MSTANTGDAEKPNKAYLATFSTNDPRAQKRCEARLLFGIVEPTETNTNQFKYVFLACPTCDFPHQFKRESWSEDVEVSSGHGYHSHGCSLHVGEAPQEVGGADTI